MERKMIAWSAQEAANCIAIPLSLDHKYSRGVLGVITGSSNYPGAAVLTTSAAAATGLGMVRFHGSARLNLLVLNSTPATVIHPGKVSAWLAGSGIDSKRYSNFATWTRHRKFRWLKKQSRPTVLDAGALYLIGKLAQPILITPHSGELATLLSSRGVKVTSQEITSDPKKWIQIAVETLGDTILLKGSITYVANDDLLIELPKATPWLSTAGTGDVLAGIIGALVANNAGKILNDYNQLARVAATGALIHALAAEESSQGGPIRLQEQIEAIPHVIAHLIGT